MKIRLICVISAVLAITTTTSYAQFWGKKKDEQIEYIVRNGKRYPVIISGTDTIPMYMLDSLEVSASRLFKNDKERYKYNQMRYNANKVKPFAIQAIKLFQEAEEETADLRKGKRLRYTKDRQKELEDKFEEPLKNLYRSQGYILIKMVERETGESMYNIIKKYKGGLKATYWNTMSMFYDYSLSEGYDPQKDPILESIIRDMHLKDEVKKLRAQEKK